MITFPQLAVGDISDPGHGIHFEMDRPRYDAIPSLNQSVLKKWIEIVILEQGCPKQFKYWFDTRNDGERSDSLIMGSALDCLLLEKERFNNLFVIVPDNAPPRPTARSLNAKNPKPEIAAAIAWWKGFDEMHEGKTQISQKLDQKIQRMHFALIEDAKVHDIFQYCKKAVLHGELNGVQCKGEVDLFCEQTEYLFDLKTAESASLKTFAKNAWNFGYHFQAAFYLKLAHAVGLTHKTKFCFVVVENNAPYCVAAYTIDFETDALQYAWKMINEAMMPLSIAFQRNQWPDFEDFEPLKFARYNTAEAREFLANA